MRNRLVKKIKLSIKHGTTTRNKRLEYYKQLYRDLQTNLDIPSLSWEEYQGIQLVAEAIEEYKRDVQDTLK